MELSSSCCAEMNIHIDLRRVSQRISVVSSRKSSHLYCILWNTGSLWSQWRGNRLHIELIWGTPSYFAFLRCIIVHLVLWQCSWGLSGVPSRKSRLLTCLIGNTGLICMQCRGIEPHFPARGMSHKISRVAAGTWSIFASYSGDGHSKLHFVQWSQDSCVVMRDTSGI